MAISEWERHAKGGQALAPPDLLARVRCALDRRPDPVLVEHHVHPLLVPERCETLAPDPKRRTPMVIHLDGFRKR